jgi:hypothetical protein
MLRYQYDCVLSELVFCCPEPEKTCCVVLGTVEIVDGCLVRVCNTPRRHVWSFANLLPVAIGAILTGNLAGQRSGEGKEEERESRPTFECCPDYGPFDCEAFLYEFETSESARYLAATAILRAAKAIFESLSKGFSFTESTAFAPAIFEQLQGEAAVRHARHLRLNASLAQLDTAPTRLNPLQALLSQVLLRPGDSAQFFLHSERRVRMVLPDQEQPPKTGEDRG